MNQSVYKICLDVQDDHAPVALNMKQFDNGRTLEIAFTDGGKPYGLTQDCEVVFTAKKPDQTVLYSLCAIAGNKAIYQVTPQTTASAGRVQCQVRIYDTNGGLSRQEITPELLADLQCTMLISTASFEILVQPLVCSDIEAVATASGTTALQNLMEQAGQNALEIQAIKARLAALEGV